MKTVRGSYYYLQVGSQFYAGTRPVMVQATARVPWAYNDHNRTPKKKTKKKPGYQETQWQMDWSLHKGRKISKGSRPGFSKLVKPEPYMTKEEVLVPSGAFEPFWSEEHNGAKKFRIHSKAVAKAEELAKLMGVSVDKIRIQLHEYEHG